MLMADCKLQCFPLIYKITGANGNPGEPGPGVSVLLSFSEAQGASECRQPTPAGGCGRSTGRIRGGGGDGGSGVGGGGGEGTEGAVSLQVQRVERIC